MQSLNHVISYLWPQGWTHTGMKVISRNRAPGLKNSYDACITSYVHICECIAIKVKKQIFEMQWLHVEEVYYLFMVIL